MTIAKQRISPLRYTRIWWHQSAGQDAAFITAVETRIGEGVAITPLGRARAGIYLLTKYALREGRRRVLLSPFTIPDVVNMVLLAGGEPEFFDFEPASTACDVDALAARVGEDTACVWITHYHVNEPRLAEVAAICRRAGALIFDDCALAFGGIIDGRPIGALTDASMFSLSGFKLVNFVWGGFVSTKDQALHRWLEGEVAAWPKLGPGDYARPAQALAKYDFATRPMLFEPVVFPMLRRKGGRPGAIQALQFVRLETDDLNATILSRPADAAFAEWCAKLPGMDAVLAGRRRIAAIYDEKLGPAMVSADTNRSGHDGACFVNYPVITPPGRQVEIVQEMVGRGFDVGLNLYPNCHRHPKFKDLPGVSENVDKLVHGTIYLPTHFGVSEDYARRIGSAAADLL